MSFSINESLFGEKFQKKVQNAYRKTIKQFKKTTRFYLLFHVGFFSLFLLEMGFFAAFVLRSPTSSLLAIIIGMVFLTIFSYLVFLFYYQAKKPDEIQVIKDLFMDSCRRAISLPAGSVEHHLLIAQAALKLANYLHDLEYRYYSSGKFLHKIFESLSAFFHREDVFKLKEMLFLAAIDEHIVQIKSTPCDLEVHTSLGSTFTQLSRLYIDKAHKSSGKKAENYQEKFILFSKRAIDEFTILEDFAPNDPWVHMQLAKCYQTLQMPEKQAEEYEKVLLLSPKDKEILFTLGTVYFQLGKNAKGLRIYEKLNKMRDVNAENLLAFYGSFQTIDQFDELN